MQWMLDDVICVSFIDGYIDVFFHDWGVFAGSVPGARVCGVSGYLVAFGPSERSSPRASSPWVRGWGPAGGKGSRGGAGARAGSFGMVIFC